MGVEALLFDVLAGIAVVSALAVVLCVRDVMAAAIALLMTLFSLAGIYVLLSANLLAVLQLVVGMGTVVVLLLFAILLLDHGAREPWAASVARSAVKAIGVALALALGALLVRSFSEGLRGAEIPAGFGGRPALARALFGEYPLPLLLTGCALLAAMAGSFFLARRRLD